MMAMLWRGHSVVGVERQRNFGSGSLPLQFLRMGWYRNRITANGGVKAGALILFFARMSVQRSGDPAKGLG